MSEGLKTLRDIGAQVIHNETHISREYVQAMIHETFDDLQSVQFVGFVSILEREYNVDLSDLRAKGKEFFKEKAEKSQEIHKVFVATQGKSNNAMVYIVLGLGLFISFAYYTFIYLDSMTPELENLDNTKIEDARKSISPTLVEEQIIVIEKNTTTSTIEEEKLLEVESLQTKIEEPVIEEVVQIEPKVETLKSLKILPKRKIWAGYINIQTNQKYQKVFRKSFPLDISKNWLLLFGAGTVKLEVNGENVKFSSKQNMRFKYVDGIFTKITVDEFKSLNKGRKW